MYFPMLVVLFFSALPSALSGTIRERSIVDDQQTQWHKIADNDHGGVFSSLEPQKREAQWHKIADNDHGGVFSSIQPKTRVAVDERSKQVFSRSRLCV